MSFGAGGGFGGFGQNNQQSTGFGGGGAFGANNNNTAGAFGQTTGSAFGASTNNATTGGIFGGNAGGFGNTGAAAGAFGQTTNNAFGAKPAFGASTTGGGGLFGGGSTTATAGPSAFGGFGGTNNAATTTSSPFGGGSMFSNNKPTGGFGAATTGATTGTSLFGGGAAAAGFGAGTTNAFGGATGNPGIGTNIGDPPGTQNVPFQATMENEANNSAAKNSFQNILFMDAYKKWSGDELRLVDYQQGRRHGTAGGAGAFGVTNSFGGGFGANNNSQATTAFGGTSTGGGLFGGNTNNQATTTFGQQPASTGGFGANTGGGLFGGNKPAATGGLFGATTNQPQQQQPAQAGGMFGAANNAFGTNNNAGGAFGTSNASAAAGGGLFGATAAKPTTGFSFGPGAGTQGAFGGNTAAGGFGANNTGTTTAGGGLFGSNNNAGQQAPAGMFGQQQQNNAGGAFGGAFGGQPQQQAGASLFGGGNAQKPAGGLFGATTNQAAAPSGGLFGASTTNAPGAFGAAPANQTGGGLFGAKPAGTTGGLFGGGTTQTGTTGGGLFGGLGASTQQQQQPAQAGGLFGGGLQVNQPKSLFGATQQQTAGGGLFGQAGQMQQSGGMFGSTQQAPVQGLGGSAFGGSQSQSAPQSLRTSLADMSAFGSSSLFAGIGSNDVQNPGPLATPLSSAKKQSGRQSILPIYKLSKPSTPKRGYGFSYSTYGSPSTPSSVASTPGGFGQSLLAGSISRGLSKSISTSNLRQSYNADSNSLLAPGAFSSSTGPRNIGGPSSVKKLVINRDIRSDLFNTPTKNRNPQEPAGSARKVTKRVSFDTPTAVGIEQGAQAEQNGPGDANPMSSIANASSNGSDRSRATNGVNGGSSRSSTASAAAPEMEQVKGNELAIVREEDSPASTPRSDKHRGYWMSPSKEEIQKMNRMQRQKVTNFTVGCKNIGQVRFRVPVDLSTIDLDEIFVGYVLFEPRRCTVYPNPPKKPAMGKGLNVPAEITLEQSWPRSSRDRTGTRFETGPRFEKHIEKLKSLPDTQFVSYNPETGQWVFTVEHFTTYGLDDDDDDDDDYDGQGQESSMQAAPVSQPVAAASLHRQTLSRSSPFSDDGEDSFEHKRQRRTVPGAFDSTDDALAEEEVSDHRTLVRLPSPDASFDSAYSGDNAADKFQDQADLEMSVEYDIDAPEIAMAGDEPLVPVALPPHAAPTTNYNDPPAAGIMRARMRALKESAAPASIEVTGGDDWMNILKKSVNSGQQRDRAALRTLQESNVSKVGGQKRSQKEAAAGRRAVSDGRGFATSIDLMNSLFGKDKPHASLAAVEKGVITAPPAKSYIKWPYQKQHQDPTEEASMEPLDRQFHNSFKPRWGPGNVLLVSKSSGHNKHLASVPAQTSTGISAPLNEIWSVSLTSAEPARHRLGQESQDARGFRLGSWVTTRPVPGKVPEIVRPDRMPSLKEISQSVPGSSPSSTYERLVWTLASILFDPVDRDDEDRRRRSDLAQFWQSLVEDQTKNAVSDAQLNEEQAFASLAGHRIVDACKHLLDARLYKLATLVPLIGTSDQVKEDMKEQVDDWYEGDVLSEIETPIRAIYSLLAGGVSVCKGKTAAGSENRLDTVALASHFGLDWKQAFGLRLWYGISTTDSIAAAVRSFEEDLERGLVPQPVPWHLHGSAQEDKENSAVGLQDMLWGLLKLYAGRASLEEILQPENSSVSHTDYSLCWQLGQVLSASGRVSFARESQSKADALTVSYGAQLMGASAWSDAVAVLLHLSDRAARARAVQDAIARVALDYASPSKSLAVFSSGPGSIDHSLGVKKLLELESRHHIPKPWLAEACALAFRYLSGQVDCTHPANFHLVMKEVRCLALADRPQELQAVVVRRLDPLAVLQWPPSSPGTGFTPTLELLVEYLRARPVDDGLADIAALASLSKKAGGARPLFDFDRYITMLRKRYEDAASDDVVTLAALSSLMEFVQDKKRPVAAF